MIVIAITGGSASGKTIFSKLLSEKLPDSFVLNQDFYFKDVSYLTQEQKMNYNFDLPESINSDEFFKNIIELKNNGETLIPEYDFSSAACKLNSTLVKKPKFLILEGIFSMYFKEIRKLTHINIFIEAEENLRFERRMKRDKIERGYTEKEITNSFFRFSKPSYEKYIEPQKYNCEYIIDSNEFEKYLDKIIDRIIEIEQNTIKL
jgi:uridine kinase